VGSRRQRSFDESEVGFVNVVADHLAAALDHAFEHRREAHTDYLTGLANRAEFESSVRRELAAAHRRGRTLSLMAMDLDQLKKINDTQGHHAGDDAIRAVAAVIRKAVRTSDISSRLGGDEFGVAMPDAGLAQAGEVVARIQGMLREHNALTRQPIDLELSFGLAEWQPGQNYDTLFQIADRNLYRDKRRHNARRARAAGAAGRLGGSKPSSPSSSLPATHST
jgi:diguanylate cyclase (GGDEF)-like protein